jgi:signal transduction histidine kinase/ABC-type nitrate/sulfonate/bicarbonate transport system substrate-binding protein
MAGPLRYAPGWPAGGALLSVLVALLMLAAAPAHGQSRRDEPDHVTLQLKWRHQFQFAGYYAAVAKGYYRDAGLEVSIVEAQPGIEPMQEMVEGRATFGVGTTDLLLMRRDGKQVVVLADIFQHSPLALMVLSGNELRNIHTLSDGKLMIEPHSAELFAYLTEEGIDPEGLDLVEHDFDVESLISGEVDAMSVYASDEPYQLAARGIPYVLLRPIESGIDFYGDNLFTMRSEIDQRPDVVRRFVDASMLGWQYAMAHPEEIAALITTQYQTEKSLPHLLFEASAMQPLVNANVVEVGYINAGRWERIAQKYANFGMVPADIDLNGFIYDPDATADYGALYRLSAALAAIVVVLAAIALWYQRLNGHLQREVAERKEVQAQLERLDGQKSLLLSIIGHDLRSPFNVLLNYGDLLVAQGERMERTRLVSVYHNVRDAAAAAYTLLNSLLDWAALQTGRSQLSAESVPVDGLIESVLGILRPVADAKEIALHAEAPSGITLYGDLRMIETVLRNLIGNALKYSRPGGTVTITAEAQGAETRISIADSGIGIAPDRLERLFELEAKRPVPGTSQESGSGIGLILCRDLVEANRGSLSVASELDKGTTVTLLLPSAPPH